MKKIIFSCLLVISAFTCFAQLKSHVDERFELTSIVFRLADAKEYVNNNVKNYATDIDKYFAAYKEHPLIQYVKELRERDEIAFNAVSGATILLEIKNRQIRLNLQADIDAFLQNEPRWKKETLEKFVKLLNKFYKDTKFNNFYNSHRNLYTETEKRFDGLLETVNTEWFQSFFGKPLGNPFVYASLCNGPSNYAITNTYNKTATSNYGIVIGCSDVDKEGIPSFVYQYGGYDKDGKPRYNREIIAVIIHEFSHRFSNPMIFKYEPEMIDAAEKIFPYVKEQLAKVAYFHSNSILIEGFNELFVMMYFKENSFIHPYNVANNEWRGFIWMSRAVRFMENFSINRNLYPSIEDFMPQLIAFISFCGENIEQIVDEYKHKVPYVVNVFPAFNTTVSADVKEIRVDFSHQMGNIYGMLLSKYPDAVLPKVENDTCCWSKDEKTLTLQVTLEKGKTYALKLPSALQSSENYPMNEDFEIVFKTAE